MKTSKYNLLYQNFEYECIADKLRIFWFSEIAVVYKRKKNIITILMKKIFNEENLCLLKASTDLHEVSTLFY